MEKKRIITIGREFGSGGRTIGKEVVDQKADNVQRNIGYADK